MVFARLCSIGPKGRMLSLEKFTKRLQTFLTIVTGVGDFYSSGNDIKSAFEEKMNPDISPTSGVDKATNFIQAFINYPKILIGNKLLISGI